MLASLHSLLNEPHLLPPLIGKPTNIIPVIQGYYIDKDGMCGGRVVDSCNGLVCIIKDGFFFLWNPATRISFQLPEIVGFQNFSDRLCGFGWDETSGAHKVFTLVISNHQPWVVLGKVYSSKTNSWTTVNVGWSNFSGWDSYGHFACGKLHWLAHRGYNCHIQSFDLNSEVFGAIELPYSDAGGLRRWFGEIKGCLSLVCSNIDKTELCVWVMKEYGVKESCLKLLTVPLTLPRRHCGLLAQFEISEEGVILVIHGSSLLGYNRDDANVLSSHIKFSTCYGTWESRLADPYNTHFYVESLVSPFPPKNL